MVLFLGLRYLWSSVVPAGIYSPAHWPVVHRVLCILQYSRLALWSIIIYYWMGSRLMSRDIVLYFGKSVHVGRAKYKKTNPMSSDMGWLPIQSAHGSKCPVHQAVRYHWILDGLPHGKYYIAVL